MTSDWNMGSERGDLPHLPQQKLRNPKRIPSSIAEVCVRVPRGMRGYFYEVTQLDVSKSQKWI